MANDNITIKKIILNNFKSHKSLELSFSDLNILIGENGAGKTTVLEAICYGLFGAVASGAKKSELVRYGEKSGGVTIIFSNDYKIVRDFSTEIRLLDNNDNIITNRASDIEAYLNLNKELFMNILYSAQNDIYSYFLRFNAKEKDFLDNLFNLDTLTDKTINRVKETINTLTIRYNDITNKINMKNSIQNNIKEMLSSCNMESIVDLERAIEISNNNLQELLLKQQDYNSKQQFIKEYEQQKLLLQTLTNSIETINNSIVQSNENIEKSQKELYNFINDVNSNSGTYLNSNELDAWYRELDDKCNINHHIINIKELINDALNNKDNIQLLLNNLEAICNIVSIIEKIDEYRRYYSNLKDTYNKLINNLNMQISIAHNYKKQLEDLYIQTTAINDKITNINLPLVDDNIDIAQLNTLLLQYQSQYTTLKTTLNNIIVYSSQLDNLANNSNDYDVDLDRIEQYIKTLNNILPVFNRDGFIAYLRKSLLKDIANNIGESLEKFGFTTLLPVAIDEKSGALTFHGRLMRTLSGGEKTCVACLMRILYARILSPSMKLNVLILDEPCAELDSVRIGFLRQMLHKLNKILNMQIIVVTHDEQLIPENANVININSN